MNLAGAALLLTTALGGDLAPQTDEPARTLWLVEGLLCLGVATLGSVAASSLLLYPPAKLARTLEGDGEALVERLTRHRTSYHALARSLAVGGTIAAAVLIWNAAPTGARAGVLAGFVLLAVLACGILPGLIASSRAERVVVATHRVLEALRVVLYYPVVLPLLTLGGWTVRLLGIRRSTDDPEKIVEDILAAVEDTVTESGLAADERSWIENIVDLKDMQASEVMTPRTDAVAFDRERPLSEAIEDAARAGYSRFPVFAGKVDNVVGVFYAKDVLSLFGSAIRADATVGDYMRRPLFVPETMGLVDLLRQFRTSRVQMAIVLDEYGGTAGLVSIEDVLEEIVGDITDEYDPHDESAIKVIEVGRVIETAGRARIEEVNEALSIDIPESEEYNTVAGFVLTSLDRIPKLHETVAIGGVAFEVLEGDERRIQRLRLTIAAPAPMSG